jgi:hypothetical protein
MYAVAAADFNGDHHLDLVTGDVAVNVMLGNGNGTFQPRVAWPAGGQPFDFAIADFNGDGALDIAVANASSWTVTVLLGKGDGTFPVSLNLFAPGGGPTSVQTADFNGDGKPDLAVANNSVVMVFLNLAL